MRIGEIIKEARERKNISLTELEKYIDRSKSAIDMLERYNIMPNFDTACMLCEILDIDIRKLWKEIRHEYINGLNKEKALESSGEEGRRSGGEKST